MIWLLGVALITISTVTYLVTILPRMRLQQQKNGVPAKGIMLMLTGNNAAFVVSGVAVLASALLLFLAFSEKQNATPPIVSINPQGIQVSKEHEDMIKSLAARLEKDPNDGKGWIMLARSYATMGRFTDAVSAYEKAAALIQNDARLLADYADVLAMANGRSLQGKPLELVYSALKIDPNNSKALLLAGKAAYQAGDYSHAIGYWQKLLQNLPPDSDFAKQVNANISQARTFIK